MGAAAASWLWWSHFRRKASVESGVEARRVAAVRVRLQELADRVAYGHDGETVDRVASNEERIVSESKDQQPTGPASCKPAKKKEGGVRAGDDATEATPDFPSTAEQNSIERFWRAYRDYGECPPWRSVSEALVPVMERHEGPSVQESPKIVQCQLDEVSGLPCRTTFCQHVQNRAAEWKRGGPTFSVILVFVDQYEQGGEDCSQRIREAAALATRRFLVASVREMDFLGSYAPGCFALLLPTTGLADAFQVAERLREEFSRYIPSAHVGQTRLTLSVGTAQVTEKDDSLSLLKRAEAALDAAQCRGGNRAYYHDGERCAPILETMDCLA